MFLGTGNIFQMNARISQLRVISWFLNTVKEIAHAHTSEWSNCEEEGARNISNIGSVFSSVYFVVLDYKILGPFRAAVGTPQFVLKARRRKDRRIVFINNYTCNETPLPRASRQLSSKSFYRSFKSVAVDLFLNPQTYRMDDVDSVRTTDKLSHHEYL